MVKRNVKKYLYYVSEMPNNVIRSQVIEYVALQEEMGLKFDILFHIRKGEYIKRFSEIDKFKVEFSKIISSKISFFPIGNKTGDLGLYSAAINLYIFLFKYRKSKKIVLHARGGFSSHVASIIKKYFKNLRIIYDIRADAFAEFEYYAKQKNMSDEKIIKSLKRGKRNEFFTVRNVEHIFTVSNILTDRFKQKYNISEEKINTIPCVADENIFYFNEISREETRDKLQIGNRFTLIYAGGIGNWHYSDKVFEIVGGIQKRFKDIFFIILTPNEKAAFKYAEDNLEEGSYFIKSAVRNEVKNFLMAADMGLLIREKHPLNEVAAPTKFAEYVMTGLPVMISEYIGDYSEFVRSKNLGIVLSNTAAEDEYLSKFESFRNDPTVPKREEIFEIGKKNFSKQKFAKLMNNVYLNL